MRKSEEIPHIHLSLVSQSGFKAKANVLKFGKLQDNFLFCFVFNFFSSVQWLQHKTKKKKVRDLFYQCSKSQGLVRITEKQESKVKAVKPPTQSHNIIDDNLIAGNPQRSICSNQWENATASAGQSVRVQKPLQGC